MKNTMVLLLLSISIQFSNAQDKDLIKENKKEFNQIIICTNIDSLLNYYKNIYLPDKLIDFVYAMKMYEISNGKTIVDQLFTSMPQNKIEFYYFYSLTENIFDDSSLNNKLNDYVNLYAKILSKNIIKNKNYMPNYLKLYCSIEGELLDVYISYFLKTVESNPKIFFDTFIKENSKSKKKIINTLKYGAIDWKIKLPQKYYNYLKF